MIVISILFASGLWVAEACIVAGPNNINNLSYSGELELECATPVFTPLKGKPLSADTSILVNGEPYEGCIHVGTDLDGEDVKLNFECPGVPL